MQNLQLYSAQQMLDIAQENALSDRHLPDIKPDQEIKTLEFYFDNPEQPDYTLIDGELWVNPVPSGRETGTVQIVGDDGFLYIQVRKASPEKPPESIVLLNRIKDCTLPEISFGNISDQITEIENLVKTLV
jgi:hypothetical protein